MSQKYIVYLITNLVNKMAYVGVTYSLERRFQEHISAARRGEPGTLHKHIRQYGADKFSIEVLSEYSTEERAADAEIRFIELLGTAFPGGYNSPAASRYSGQDKPRKILDDTDIRNIVSAILEGREVSQHQRAYTNRTQARDLLIVALLYSTGLKLKDVINLNAADLDYSQPNIIKACFPYALKTPMPALGQNRLIKMYDETSALSTKPRTPLLRSMQNTRMTTKAVENVLKKWGANAGYGDALTPRTLRHAYLVRAFDASGGNPRQFAELYGTRDIGVAYKQYAKIVEERRTFLE